jgi:hypothetical protein
MKIGKYSYSMLRTVQLYYAGIRNDRALTLEDDSVFQVYYQVERKLR